MRIKANGKPIVINEQGNIRENNQTTIGTNWRDIVKISLEFTETIKNQKNYR